MVEVTINGFTYYADIYNRILYTDRNRKNGTPFSYLTENELKQVENQIRFPKSKKED